MKIIPVRTDDTVHLDSDIDADLIGIHWQENAVCFYVSHMREGRLLSGEHFVVERLADIPPETNDVGEVILEDCGGWRAEAVESFLCQYYLRNFRPPMVVFPALADVMSAARTHLLEKFLSELKDNGSDGKFSLVRNLIAKSSDDKIFSKKKGLAKSFRALCESASETAKERYKDWLRTDETARDGLEGLATFLSLGKLPVWMECFDISTFQGSETVASQVVFRDGKPARGDYRRYIIKETHGQDDFGSLREVMRRRFKEERRHEIPDLLIVDGGEPQVREVGYVLRALGLGKIGLVGIAKSRTERAFTESRVNASEERLVVPERVDGEIAPEIAPQTCVLRVGSSEFRLVTRMRDEAHRFAITLHRNRRDKVSRMSVLHRIDGLGPKKRKALLLAFSGMDEIVAVSVDEIAARAGISVLVAQKVKDALEKIAG